MSNEATAEGTTVSPKKDDQENVKKTVRIAVAGCAHGEIDKIYATLGEIENERGHKFDLLICCGDYQSVRNPGDLEHMHVKDKFKSLQTFYKYYSGELTAPILTLFVGGNHEASGYLSELPYGGWVAEKIYYLGFSNVVRFAGLRIAGLSGIFKGQDFHKGHFERPPYINETDKISAYHVRNMDVWRLKQLRPADDDRSSNPIDIAISHDWPAGITDFGDVNKLLRIKPFFKEDINSGKLGNPSTMQLLYDIRPKYWLSAHLHVMFAALVPHTAKEGEKEPEPTRFLALDKPIPHRHFLHAIDIEVDAEADMNLSYDPAWLSILRSTDTFTSCSRSPSHLPSSHSAERWDFRPTPAELDEIKLLGDLRIPFNFKQTAPPFKKTTEHVPKAPPSLYYRNPQSSTFCTWLGISDLNKMLADSSAEEMGIPYYMTAIEGSETADANEIRLDDEAFGDEDFIIDRTPTQSSLGPGETAGETDIPEMLTNFEAPAWKGSERTSTTEEKEMPKRTFKRRLVDLDTADETV